MPKSKNIVCLDVGEKRIGVAVGDELIKIAVPFDTVDVDGNEMAQIMRIIDQQNAGIIVIGYPRNQSGEATKQTKYVEDFAAELTKVFPNVVFQDESLTSVLAEDRLKSYAKPYTKSDIDAQAAAIILQDYLEAGRV